jgi:hypothetical protein
VRLLDSRTAIALGEPGKHLLKKWNCPRCQKPFAWLWSTGAGRLLHVIVPPKEPSTTEQLRRRRVELGSKLHLGGARVCAEFVEEITETSVEALCGRCGPQQIDISNLRVR